MVFIIFRLKYDNKLCTFEASLKRTEKNRRLADELWLLIHRVFYKQKLN